MAYEYTNLLSRESSIYVFTRTHRYIPREKIHTCTHVYSVQYTQMHVPDL